MRGDHNGSILVTPFMHVLFTGAIACDEDMTP